MKMLSATSVSPDRYRPAIARSGARRKPGVCFTCVDGPAPPATKNANRRRTLVRRRLREGAARARSEEHTSELQSLMRISYAVFCMKKKTSGEYSYVHSKRC